MRYTYMYEANQNDRKSCMSYTVSIVIFEMKFKVKCGHVSS